MRGAILLLMSPWLAAIGAFLGGVGATKTVSVHRYSRGHVEGEVAIRGRGLFFSRTPDGTWSKLRLRARRCNTTFPVDWDNGEPPEGGVREPRRPPGIGPRTGSVKLEPPGR
jgi:hypothetical protein